ncbi:MAG: hypothetical protein IK080_08840 [Clostridia bacterium]|nr:hypothetical protein [Clostridia bacterium]
MLKQITRRCLSILLIASLLLSSLFISGVAIPETEGTDLPTVYVMGMGCPIVTMNPDGTKHFIYPIEIDTDEIMQIAKDNIDVYLRAVATQQWDEFCDLLCETIIPYFEEFKLSPDGEAHDGSYPDYPMTQQAIRERCKLLPNGQYPIQAFEFHYDFRLDPCAIADLLAQYIRDVKAVTGAEEVNLIGRCLGSNVVAAYLQKYGCEGLAQVLFTSSALLGAPLCSKSFCGELRLDGDAIERYLYDKDLSAVNTVTDIDDLDALLLSFITVFNDLGGLDLASFSFNQVLPKIYLKIFPRILQESFGTCPAFWSMVSDEDYEKAKETVFYGIDTADYAGLIEKIDTYHTAVQLQAKPLLKSVNDSGVPVHCVSKYGRQTIPVTDRADELSDGIVYTHDSSFGATTAKVDSHFHYFYMNRAQKDGRLDSISSDRQIDASSCWFPNKTWFIKDLAHGDFPDGIYDLFFKLLNDPRVTIHDLEDYPQFLVYDSENDQLLPLNSGNHDTTGRWRVSFLLAFVDLMQGLSRLMVKYIHERLHSEN